MQKTIEIFQERVLKFTTLAKKHKADADIWTLIRGASFIATLIFTYIAAIKFGNFEAVFIFLIGFGLFLFTVSKHQSILLLLKKAKIMANINENEIKRMEGNYSEIPNGAIFSDPKHFYSADLDLFGKSSLFQLLNRTHTHAGGTNLANWLMYPATKTVIWERQNAIEEISSKLEFRQKLEMEALLSDKIGASTHKLLDWINAPQNFKINKPIFKIAKYLPVVTLLVLIGAIMGLYTFYFVALLLLIHGIILKQIDEDVSTALEETEIAGATLKPYSVLLQMINVEHFSEPTLVNLKNKITNAPLAVAELEKIIHNLSYRSNPAFALTGGIFMMWDLQYLQKLETWKAKYNKQLKNWLGIVSEFEALNSLAGYSFASPEYCTPTISDETIFLKTSNMGHPMIKSTKRVTNDIKLIGIGKTHIITGSNMSGKSTFERTVAMNIVLALMGAKVCASNFETSVLQVFTSMRTQDSLEAETSSFYAELKRLEQLIKLTKFNNNQLPTLYFLDEILKGTNSKDRHIGAKALILQLNKANASGFISTHDVELGDEFKGSDFVENYSFSSEVNEKGLIFDYKLRTGVCHSFNASALMSQIGIEI